MRMVNRNGNSTMLNCDYGVSVTLHRVQKLDAMSRSPSHELRRTWHMDENLDAMSDDSPIYEGHRTRHGNERFGAVYENSHLNSKMDASYLRTSEDRIAFAPLTNYFANVQTVSQEEYMSIDEDLVNDVTMKPLRNNDRKRKATLEYPEYNLSQPMKRMKHEDLAEKMQRLRI